MLARTGPMPVGDGWAVEVKFDGMRLQLRREGRAVCLRSRPGRACTDEFPELAGIERVLGRHRVLLDGELVCLASDGNPDFASLRRRLRAPAARARHAERSPATFLAFDLLHFERSTREFPYERGRELLLDLALDDGPAWRAPRHLVVASDRVLAATRERGIEGVVAKRLASPYLPGARNGVWVKHPSEVSDKCSVGYPSKRSRMRGSPLRKPEGTTPAPWASSRPGSGATLTAATTWSGCAGRRGSSARGAGTRADGDSPTAALSARPARLGPRPRRERSSIAPAPRSPSGSPPAGCSPRRRTGSRRCR